MEHLTSVVSRVSFVIAFLLASVAIGEKLLNMLGFTLTRAYSPWRFLEFTAVVLLFVIALQLREIKIRLRGEGTRL
jgi:hypothetical protein